MATLGVLALVRKNDAQGAQGDGEQCFFISDLWVGIHHSTGRRQRARHRPSARALRHGFALQRQWAAPTGVWLWYWPGGAGWQRGSGLR